jgi:hypothetical protein
MMLYSKVTVRFVGSWLLVSINIVPPLRFTRTAEQNAYVWRFICQPFGVAG